VKYFPLFSGIGGFELGFPRSWKCAGFSEVDKHAIRIIDRTSVVIPTMATSQKSTPQHSPTSTFSAADFRARASQLLENEEDLPTREELSSLRSRVLPQIKDLDFYCLKTSKGFSRTILASLLRPSSKRLMNWGMTSNGKCLTASISESPRIGKECSLSEILEEHIDPKYFLSTDATRYIFKKSRKGFPTPKGSMTHADWEER
jgi:hypothetical protein